MTTRERDLLDDAILDAEADWLSDDEIPLTEVFPDGFSAPCERCGGSSMGDRFCPECECELERWA